MVQSNIAATPQQNILPWRPFPRPNHQHIGRTFEDAPLYPTKPRPYGYSPWGGFHQPKGYGLDLNHDGKFDPKNDGYLSFDLNRDGRHTDQEIQQSRNLLKAFGGDFDTNGDGHVDFGETFQGYSNYFQARSMDFDRDGTLSKWELQRAGGSVVQRDNGPRILDGIDRPLGAPDGQAFRPSTGWRSLGLNNLPGGRSLDYVNPWRGTFGTSPNFRFFTQIADPLATTNG